MRAMDMGVMAYPPLEQLKPVADGVWLVDSVLGKGLPVRMTVIRLASGDLLLHSPIQYAIGVRQSLEALGRIRHLVAPNTVHWMFVKSWQDAVPQTRVWAAPGLRDRRQVRRSGLRIDAELSDAAPAEWSGEIEQVVVPGRFGFREVVMLHAPSRTALFTDLVQNFEPEKLPKLLLPLGRVLGNVSPSSQAPAYLRLLMGKRGRDPARRIVAWAPQRVLVTHGAPIETDAATRLRRSLAWLTGEPPVAPPPAPG